MPMSLNGNRRLVDLVSVPLVVTPSIAEQTGKLMAIRTRSSADCLIAGTALVHGLTLVSRNVSDFSDTGVSILNPWDSD